MHICMFYFNQLLANIALAIVPAAPAIFALGAIIWPEEAQKALKGIGETITLALEANTYVSYVKLYEIEYVSKVLE